MAEAALAPASGPVITGLDHVVIGVADLEPAIAAMRALLGRDLSWRAPAAEGGGTEVALFRLTNMAVELMAPAGDGPLADRLRAALARDGEGLLSLAFATDDIGRLHSRLTRTGCAPEPITPGDSVDALTGAQRSWRRTRVGPDASAGLRLFALERDAPLPPAPPLATPDSALVEGLDHIVMRTPAPDRAAALFGARLGLDMRLDQTTPAWGVRLMFFRCGDLIVEVAHDLNAGAGDGPDRLWGLSWRVRDADAARARLHAAGLDVSEVRAGRKPGTRVFTVRNGTCGVPTLMVEPAQKPARKDAP